MPVAACLECSTAPPVCFLWRARCGEEGQYSAGARSALGRGVCAVVVRQKWKPLGSAVTGLVSTVDGKWKMEEALIVRAR
jgi:hypothetical protein